MEHAEEGWRDAQAGKAMRNWGRTDMYIMGYEAAKDRIPSASFADWWWLRAAEASL